MQPLLSLVVPARNDNHGGDFLKRMQYFVDGLLFQSARHRLSCELIIVEWNPPARRPRLDQALKLPPRHPFCEIRVIEVPAKIHARYKYAKALPLYQMIGKNVGIRRARGQYILATNIDILFSDELCEFFASGRLRPNRLYRVDRYDVDNRLPESGDFSRVLEYCRNNVLRINGRYGTYFTRTGTFSPIYHQQIDTKAPLYRFRPALHTNACGDFQLMHRGNWEKLRGYAEFDMFSFHLDSVMEAAAHFGGAPEEALPAPLVVYHIEHESGFTPERAKKLEKRLAKAKIRSITDDELLLLMHQISQRKSPMLYNDANWGLADTPLPENTATVLNGKGKPAALRLSREKKKEPALAITIFTIPKPFTGQNAVDQLNAIQSWLALRPRPEVILAGDARGVRETAERFGLKHIPGVAMDKRGEIRMADVFKKALRIARSPVLCYAFPTLILIDDFSTALRLTAERFTRFAFSGQRHEADFSGKIDFSAQDWQNRVLETLSAPTTIYNDMRTDYVVFTRNACPDLPKGFVAGNDMPLRWILQEAARRDTPVVNASPLVTALHPFTIPVREDKTEAVNYRIRANLAAAGADFDNENCPLEYANWSLTFSGPVPRQSNIGQAARAMPELKDYSRLYLKNSPERNTTPGRLWFDLGRYHALNNSRCTNYCYLKSAQHYLAQKNRDADDELRLGLAFYHARRYVPFVRQFFKILDEKNVSETKRHLAYYFLAWCAKRDGQSPVSLVARKIFDRLVALAHQTPAYERYLWDVVLSAVNEIPDPQFGTRPVEPELCRYYLRRMLEFRNSPRIKREEVLFYLGRYHRGGAAREYLRQALGIYLRKPSKTSYERYIIATALLMLGRSREAEKWLIPLLRTGRSLFEKSRTHLKLALACQAQGKNKEAADALLEALRHNPNNPLLPKMVADQLVRLAGKEFQP